MYNRLDIVIILPFIELIEGLDKHTQFVLEIAALMHDIGIREGERLYGRNDGEIQQELQVWCSQVFFYAESRIYNIKEKCNIDFNKVKEYNKYC